jgi:hypothetical protein
MREFPASDEHDGSTTLEVLPHPFDFGVGDSGYSNNSGANTIPVTLLVPTQ